MQTFNLEKPHSELLDMLVEFAAFCEEYGIGFFWKAGLRLEQSRHNGFIPWDDDTDIGMFREDYEKFLGVANEIPC